ncbi:lysozyme [Pedobacter sp. HDW13]|nr:lysozyme [Pedobacter sp. HDW13]RQO64438.1 lysozyme [Pedobacter sp. KBW01]
MTIGYGHKLTSQEISSGTYASGITQQQAHALFMSDAQNAINAVNSQVTVSLTQNQFDALVSFVYNTGGGAFGNSTLLSKLNSGDYSGAAAQMDRWVYASGGVVNGLVNRRNQEQDLFSNGDYQY